MKLCWSPKALVALVCASTFSFAAEPRGDDPNTETLVVLGTTYRHTATKSALEPDRTPQGISVISAETLSLRGTDSVAEALRYVPGVTTELRGGAVSRLDLFNIRGFETVQNYFDGLQLLYNGWNLQPQIDAAAVRQIEVFKGPTSVLYGNMPPGGLVNLIGYSPERTPQHEVELATGSRNLRAGTLRSTGPIGDSPLSYTALAKYSERDGQARSSEEERQVVSSSVDWDIAPSTLLNVNLYYQNDPEAGVYNSLPAAGTALSNPNGALPEDAFAGDRNWDHYEREVLLAGYKFSHEFAGAWNFLHQARYMLADAYQENTYNIGLSPLDERTLGRRAYLTDEASRGITVDNQLGGLVSSGEVVHQLLLGVDYLRLDSEIKYEDASAPPIDLFAPNHAQIVPVTLDFAASGLSSDFGIDVQQLGVYVQDQLEWDALVVVAGLRWDDYQSDEKGRKYGAASNTKVDQEQVSGRLGALYQLPGGIAPFASYAESFEPVPGTDRNLNPFEPATAHQWEAGVKYRDEASRTDMTVSAFRITKENVVTRDPSGGPLDQIQAGEVRSQGLELELTAQPTPALSLHASATLLDMEVTKDNNGLEGKTPVWVAERTASLWANYLFLSGPMRGANLGVGVRHVGETQLDSLNSDTLPSHTLYDLGLGFDLGNSEFGLLGWSLELVATNLFDRRTVSCYDQFNCWFGAERSLEARLRYRH